MGEWMRNGGRVDYRESMQRRFGHAPSPLCGDIGAGEVVAYGTGARGAVPHKSVVIENDGVTALIEVTWFPDNTVSRREVPTRTIERWRDEHRDIHHGIRAANVARRAREA